MDTTPPGLGEVCLQSPPQGPAWVVMGAPASSHLPARPHPPGTPQQHLEVVVDQEVTANEVEVAQLALELGLDGQEAVGHDLLHLRLSEGQAGAGVTSGH